MAPLRISQAEVRFGAAWVHLDERLCAVIPLCHRRSTSLDGIEDCLELNYVDMANGLGRLKARCNLATDGTIEANWSEFEDKYGVLNARCTRFFWRNQNSKKFHVVRQTWVFF